MDVRRPLHSAHDPPDGGMAKVGKKKMTYQIYQVDFQVVQSISLLRSGDLRVPIDPRGTILGRPCAQIQGDLVFDNLHTSLLH